MVNELKLTKFACSEDCSESPSNINIWFFFVFTTIFAPNSPHMFRTFLNFYENAPFTMNINMDNKNIMYFNRIRLYLECVGCVWCCILFSALFYKCLHFNDNSTIYKITMTIKAVWKYIQSG